MHALYIHFAIKNNNGLQIYHLHTTQAQKNKNNLTKKQNHEDEKPILQVKNVLLKQKQKQNEDT